MEGLLRSTITQFEKYVNLSKKVPGRGIDLLTGIDEPGRLADTIAAHMSVDLKKNSASSKSPVFARLEHLLGLMEAEIDLFRSKADPRSRQETDGKASEYYLNEQMKAIQKELGEMDEAPANWMNCSAHRRGEDAGGGQRKRRW